MKIFFFWGGGGGGSGGWVRRIEALVKIKKKKIWEGGVSGGGGVRVGVYGEVKLL